MLELDQQPAELTQPCIGSFHDLSGFVTPHCSSVVVTPSFVILPAGRNQFDGLVVHPWP